VYTQAVDLAHEVFHLSEMLTQVTVQTTTEDLRPIFRQNFTAGF